MTLAVFGQWARFPGERAFDRDAASHVRSAFPTLSECEPCHRLPRSSREAMVAFALFLVEQMQTQDCLSEARDRSGVSTCDARRRGTDWLAGQADIGRSHRMGWYEGLHLLTSMTPTGVITGFGFVPARCPDQALAPTRSFCHRQRRCW